MFEQNYTMAIGTGTTKTVTNAFRFEAVKIYNSGIHLLYVVYLSGQLSYFMSICTYVSFFLFYMEIFFLFSMLVIPDTAVLKKVNNKMKGIIS